MKIYFTLILVSTSLKFSQPQTTQTDNGNLFPLIQGKRLTTGPDVSFVTSTFQSSQSQCFSRCSADGTCRCASFKKSSGACSLFADNSWEIGFTVVDDADSVIFQKLADTVKYGEWTLAFRGLAGINKPIYDAYTDIATRHDQPVSLSFPLGCVRMDTALPCEFHFHSNILNDWNTLKISQGAAYVNRVRISDGSNTVNLKKFSKGSWTMLLCIWAYFFSNHEMSSERYIRKLGRYGRAYCLGVMFTFYSGGVMKRFILFNGTATTLHDWFQPRGVLNSSWDDLTIHQSYTVFNSTGYTQSGFNRRFLVQYLYGSCTGDIGWIGVVDQDREICAWATRTPSFPRFTYSPGSTKVYNDVMLYADILAIFVKL